MSEEKNTLKRIPKSQIDRECRELEQKVKELVTEFRLKYSHIGEHVILFENGSTLPFNLNLSYHVDHVNFEG